MGWRRWPLCQTPDACLLPPLTQPKISLCSLLHYRCRLRAENRRVEHQAWLGNEMIIAIAIVTVSTYLIVTTCRFCAKTLSENRWIFYLLNQTWQLRHRRVHNMVKVMLMTGQWHSGDSSAASRFPSLPFLCS